MGFSLSSLPNPHQQAFGMQLDQVENDPPQPREGSSSRPDNGSEWRRKEASKQLLKPNPQLLRLSPQLCLTLPGTIPSRRGGMWGCGSHTAPSHHVQHHQAHTPARFLTPEAPVCWIILPQGWVITVPNPMYGGSILGLQRNSPSLLFASQPVPRVPQFLHLRVKQEVYQTPPGGTHKQLWCFRGHNSSPCSVQEQVLRTQRGKTNTSEKKIRSKPSDPKLNFPPPLVTARFTPKLRLSPGSDLTQLPV